MAVKRNGTAKKSNPVFSGQTDTPEADVKHAAAPFVTEIVSDQSTPDVSGLPVNEGVDVSEEALSTIKEKAEEIEEVVEEIQKEAQKTDALNQEQASREESGDGQPEVAVTANNEGEKETLVELFTKETPQPTASRESEEVKHLGAAPVFLWAVIVIGVALLTGGVLLVAVSSLPKVPALFAKPTPTPTPAPTPSPSPAVPSRGDLKVQVLNGGGTPGSAGKVRKFLEDKGYTVKDVGNAEEYTYQKTEIHVRPDKSAYLDLLKADVSKDYTIGTSSADLSPDSPYDAQVIVGKE